MHEAQGAQFPDLAFVNRWLKPEVELLEGLDVWQMCELQPCLQIALASGIGFGVQSFEQEVSIGRLFLRSTLE